ncbi:MAG TPA: hypothetical protein VMB18_13725 [Terriglobales bacterium]|nr:hypothetical protein [Terriglobales bacterium]
MKASFRFLSFRVTILLLGLCLTSIFASGVDHYVITNDDVPPNLLNGISIYSISPGGQLTYQESIRPGGYGIGGGYFGMDRVLTTNMPGYECAYFSEAFDGFIVGVVLQTGAVGAIASGSSGDQGTTNGIGLALNSQYLYASFSDSNTIGTFQLQPGCGLTFVNDISVAGLQGGVIDAMAIHGDILVATFGDGSIASFNIAGGTPVPNGDEQNSSAYNSSQGATYPSAIDITADGHFAIFGDTSTAAVVEVSDISSGLLTKTVVYQSTTGINSSNIMLSPDETLLYVVGTQADRLGAAYFDKKTGKVSPGCLSNFLNGYVQNYSYLAGLSLATNTGTGDQVYIAEFGSPSSIAEVRVTSLAGKCSLREAPNSPVSDPYSPGLLSIASYPPRSF